jgi:hypothetical protein
VTRACDRRGKYAARLSERRGQRKQL